MPCTCILPGLCDLDLQPRPHPVMCGSSSDVIAEEKDEKMIEFAMGGICNCCVDTLNRDHLLSGDCLDLTIKCLSR